METEVPSEVSSENVVTSSELTSENASDDAEAVRDVFAMDTYMTVKAYGSNGDAAVDAAVDEINRLDALLSTGKKDSEIGQINANNGGQLSEDGAVLMERSLELYKSTNGAFDVAIYPVMKAWGFTDGNYQVPDADTLKVYRPGCLEHYVLHQLRNDPGFVPELDFVMLLKENDEEGKVFQQQKD